MNLILASLENNNLMLLSILLLVITLLSSISSWYVSIKFKKNKTEIKFVNIGLLSTMLVLQITSIIAALMSLISYLGLITPNKSLTQTLTIVFIVFSAVFSAIWFLMVIFFSNNIWFYIDLEQGKLVTLGESVKLSKITKIIEDDSKSAVYLNYLEGKRTLKKIKFSKTTTIGMYFLENASSTGVKVEKGIEINYFKDEVVKIRATVLKASRPEVKNQETKIEKEKKEEKKEEK